MLFGLVKLLWPHVTLVLVISIATQPPTVACKVEAQSEYVHVAHTFLARFAPTCNARSVISEKKKFLHRSSGGSLLGVRCLVGCASFCVNVWLKWELFSGGWIFTPP